jgi:Zn-dependent peptidase ImmA (M78 family)
MLTLDLFEDFKEPTLIDALRDFLPVALKVLDLDHVPKIKLKKELKDTHVPTFGRFTNDEQVVYCVINNRHPNDILRTLAHEMAHYAQGQRDELDADSWHTGSPVEDQANAQAGVVMREFNKQFPQYMALKPIVVENCDAKNAVPELKAALEKRKTELKNADAKVAYDKIDKIMTRIAQTYNISGQELHDLWTERYGEIPDTWVLGESKETRQALSDQDF